MACKPKELSGCIPSKKIQYLNDKFPQLPFELGCLLDEAFLKIVKELNMKCMYECDSTGTTFYWETDGDGVRTNWTDSSKSTPYTPIPPFKPAPTDRPRADIEPILIEAEDQNGLCIWVKKIEGINADGTPMDVPPKYYTEPDCLNEVTTADFEAPLKPKQPEVVLFEEIDNAKQTVEVTDASPITLTPPPNATGARIQVSGCIRACSDGTTPTPTTGFRFGDNGLFNLGCVDADTQGNDPDQLANFKAIAEAGKSGTLTITYFEKVIS